MIIYFLFYDPPRRQCVFVFDRVTRPYILVVFAAPRCRVFSRTVVSRSNMRRPIQTHVTHNIKRASTWVHTLYICICIYRRRFLLRVNRYVLHIMSCICQNYLFLIIYFVYFFLTSCTPSINRPKVLKKSLNSNIKLTVFFPCRNLN